MNYIKQHQEYYHCNISKISVHHVTCDVIMTRWMMEKKHGCQKCMDLLKIVVKHFLDGKHDSMLVDTVSIDLHIRDTVS